MEFIIGNQELNVEELSILQNMNQDLANSIATGPQDTFFEKLDRINDDLSYFGLPEIDVTNKWNWKPGTYDIVRNLVERKLEMHKKSKGINNFIRRTKEHTYYLNHILSITDELEQMKYSLKQQGVVRDVNVDEFKEIANVFVNKVQEQSEIASDISNERVTINSFIDLNSNSIRRTELLFEIIIKDIEMMVYDGRVNAQLIQKIDLNKNDSIRIIAKTSLRHVLNGMRTDVTYQGKLLSNLPIRHPYISYHPYRSSGGYGTVCLDNYRDDVTSSIKSINFANLQHHLLSWSQYYHTQHSNPYNNIKMFHIGFPESYSNEYKNVISSIADDCSSRLSGVFNVYDDVENVDKYKNACNQANCDFRDSCYSYKLVERYDSYDEEQTYMDESVLGYMAELTNATNGSYNYPLIDTYLDYFGLGVKSRSNLDKLLFYILHDIKLRYHSDDIRGGIDYQYLLMDHDYWPPLSDEEVKITEENKIKQQMKAWATNPERR